MKVRVAAKIVSWALYDLAVKFFTLNIVSLHFVRWITIQKNLPDICYSLTFGVSLLIVFLSAPLIGKIADFTGKRGNILAIFTLIAAASIFLIGFTSNPFIALVFFALANLSIQLAVIIYNSLISAVAPANKLGFVSGVGKMLGFAGALGILYWMAPIVEKHGYHYLFQISGFLLFLFSLPCIIVAKSNQLKKGKSIKQIISVSQILITFKSTLNSFKSLCKLPGVKNLFRASFFFFCPLNVIILFMAVYLTKVFGLTESEIVNVIAVAAGVAVLSSLSFGILGDKVGYKRTLYFIFFLIFTGFILASLTTVKAHALWLGAFFGLIYGAIMTVPRALAAAIIPEEKISELFGFFAVIGYLAGIIGPLFWGLMLLIFRPLGVMRYRIVFSSLSLFIIPAVYYFARIPQEEIKFE